MRHDNLRSLYPLDYHTNQPQGKVGGKKGPSKERVTGLQPYDLDSAKEVALTKATTHRGLGPKHFLGVRSLAWVGCWGLPPLG